MQVRKSNRILCTLLLVCFATEGDEAQSQALIVQATEISRPIYDDVRIIAHARDGTPVQYHATRGKVEILVAVKVGHGAQTAVSLPYATYPKIAMSSIEIGYRDDYKTATVSFSFGEFTDCFSNSDGRDKVTVEFDGSSSKKYVRSLNCKR